MAITKHQTRRGARWRLKWRENGRQRSRTFLLRSDAEMWDAERRARQRKGLTMEDDVPLVGRPPIGTPITVTVPDDVLAWIDECAKECGWSRAEWVRNGLVAEFVKARR
jgi:hypothetical protein